LQLVIRKQINPNLQRIVFMHLMTAVSSIRMSKNRLRNSSKNMAASMEITITMISAFQPEKTMRATIVGVVILKAKGAQEMVEEKVRMTIPVFREQMSKK